MSRGMRSGCYIASDVHCKVCRENIGWFYEFSFDRAQTDKEGKTVLEFAKLRRRDEKEVLVDSDRAFLLASRGNSGGDRR